MLTNSYIHEQLAAGHGRDLLKPPSATGWPDKPAHVVMVDICRAGMPSTRSAKTAPRRVLTTRVRPRTSTR
jgi:hypothetical protein